MRILLGFYCDAAWVLVGVPRRLIAATPAAASAAKPPSASPHRAPAISANHPTMGPPKVVEPRNATDHSDITRPRIWGELSSCSRLLPSEEKLIEAAPTATSARPERSTR